MLHFTNQELAKTYHVSVRTVRNWIEAARQGKLDLTLHAVGERSYVANTSRNLTTLKNLSEKGKKYRPHSSQKTVTPKEDFYKVYNQAQIYDIISNLEIHHEIPIQYNYFDDGAVLWDSYAHRLASEDTPNNLNATVNLLEINRDYFDYLLKNFSKVNFIDIGVGNALPVRHFLEHLINVDKLGRYIALDISKSMLDIAEKNVRSWFGDKIHYEGYDLDFNYDRFTSILAEDQMKTEGKDVCNILFLSGGTLGNLRSPDAALRIFHDSMGKNDFFVYEKKLDTMATRQYFDFSVVPGDQALAPLFGRVVDTLNIDNTMYDVELGFDEVRKERFERIRFKISLTIEFTLKTGKRNVYMNKNDSILVWRGLQQSAVDVITQLDNNDFYPLHASQTDDQEYILTISRIKRN